MKEATGELNATVIVLLLIGILFAFFFFVLWPIMKEDMIYNSRCSGAMCFADSVDKDGMADCVYKDKKGNTYNLRCVWKG